MLKIVIFLLILVSCNEEPPPDPTPNLGTEVTDKPTHTTPADAGPQNNVTDAGSLNLVLPGDTVVSGMGDAGTETNLWPADPQSQNVDAGQQETNNSLTTQLGETKIRQLLSYQYKESIRQLLGESASEALSLLEDDTVENYVSIGSTQSVLSLLDLEVYEQNAFNAVSAAMSVHHEISNHQTPWLWCEPISLLDTQCMTEIVYRFGRRAFRRPLTEQEMLRWRSVAMSVVDAYQNYNLGIQYLLVGMLQSPYFLYLIEIGYPDDNDPGLRWLSPYEIASRLSYFLTAGPPSEELLDAAQAGDLDSTVGIRAQAESLLQKPEAKAAMREFFRERFGLNKLASLEKEPLIYPQFSQTVALAMEEETLRLVEEVLWIENVDFRTVLTAPYTFVNETLLSHYEIPSDAVFTTEWIRHDFSDDDVRGGLLSQGSILSVHSTERRTSPTFRGKFIRQALLCQDISPPPLGVDTNLPEIADNQPHKTMRERLDDHQADVSCATCHASMDPLGLGLEHFNGVGQYRETDEGLTIDTTGVLFGQPFDGPKSMGEILQNREETALCLVRHLFRHLVGHREINDEKDHLILLDYLFELDGYRLKDFMLSMVTTTLFRTIGTAEGMTAHMTATSEGSYDGGLTEEVP